MPAPPSPECQQQKPQGASCDDVPVQDEMDVLCWEGAFGTDPAQSRSTDASGSMLAGMPTPLSSFAAAPLAVPPAAAVPPFSAAAAVPAVSAMQPQQQQQQQEQQHQHQNHNSDIPLHDDLSMSSDSIPCHCGRGGLSDVKLQRVIRCGACKSSRNIGCRVFQCTACGASLCLKCKREGRTTAAADIEAAAVRPVELITELSTDLIDDSQEEAANIAETLLMKLRRLPPVLPVTTPERVPLRARKRIGRLQAELLQSLLCAMTLDEEHGAEVAEEAALLCMHGFALIARRKHADPGPPANNREPQQWAVLRRRLQMAEAGMWTSLVEELLADCAADEDARREVAEWGASGGSEQTNLEMMQRRLATAASRVNHCCTRSAAQILRGQAMLPPCDATVEAQLKLLRHERSETELEAMHQAIQEAIEAARAHPVQIKIKHVTKRLRALKRGARPGGSRMMNDVLLSMGESKRGKQLLVEWSQRWADARVPINVASALCGQTIRPLQKENGKPRNISLMEVLIKFASGTVQEAIRDGDRAEGLDWKQYSAHPAGPELMLMVSSGIMSLRPDLAFVTIDGENAYGTISRVEMLRSAVEFCPQHAGLLACQWRAETRAFLETAPGKWTKHVVTDGTAQGDTGSTPAFARAYRAAIANIAEELAVRNIWCHLPSLVDDLLLICEPEQVDEAMEVVRSTLGKIGIKVNLDKSAVYVQPGSRAARADTFPVLTVPRALGGLPALGSAYAGEFETVLGPEAAQAEPARKRLLQAKRLAEACTSFKEAGLPIASLQPAWHILQAVAARALAYDVRTLDSKVVLPLAQDLDRAIAKAAQTLVGAEARHGWDANADLQLSWPLQESGMGFGAASVTALIGRVATLAQCLPTARQHLRNLFPTDSEMAILEAIPLGGADTALEHLQKEYGIEVAATGEVAVEKEPRLNLHGDFGPIRGVTGKITRAIYEKQRMRLLAELEVQETVARDAARRLRRSHPDEASRARQAALGFQRSRVRLRATAGAGCFDWVTAAPTEARVQLNDEEFMFAVRWRLGIALHHGQHDCGLRAKRAHAGDAHPSQTVQSAEHVRARARQRCGKFLDPHGDHALLCSRGAGRYRVHNSVCRVLAEIAREIGAEVETEEVCPSLLKGTPGAPDSVEARLDVHLWMHGRDAATEKWIDVVVTHPWRIGARAAAATTDGSAAATAEGKKLTRYGSGRGGIFVSPFAIEAWGRFGGGAEQLLGVLLGAWARKRAAPVATSSAILSRWRAAISAAVCRAQAATITAAWSTGADDVACSTEDEGTSP